MVLLTKTFLLHKCDKICVCAHVRVCIKQSMDFSHLTTLGQFCLCLRFERLHPVSFLILAKVRVISVCSFPVEAE